MKKGLLLVMAIAAVAAISQWPSLTEDAPIEKSSAGDAPEVLGSSSKTILAKSVNDDEAQEGEIAEYNAAESD